MASSIASLLIFLVVMFFAHRSHRIIGEPRDWALYYATLLAIVLSFITNFFLREKNLRCSFLPSAKFLKMTLAACLLLMLTFIPFPYEFAATTIGLFFGFVYAVIVKRTQHLKLSKLDILVLSLTSALAWKLSYRPLWWETSYRATVLGSSMKLCVFLAIFVFIVMAVYQKFFMKTLVSSRKLWLRRFIDCLSLLIFFAASLRPNRLNGGVLHHMSFFVGPIDLLKQGGRLLWDIPSQYGFLNILLASLFDSANSWVSFIIFQKILIFASSVALYFLLVEMWSSLSGRILSIALTLAAIYGWGGITALLSGPFPYPSTGAVRFFFCYVLLFYCFFISKKANHTKELQTRKVRWVGSLLWSLGIFWSVESAVYATAIWLTFCFVVDVQALEIKDGLTPWIHAVKKQFQLLVFPLSGIGLVTIVYFLSYGIFPDWYGFVEYAVVYKNGYGSLPIDMHSAVWSVFFLVVILTLSANLLMTKNNRYAGCSAAGLAMVWGTASYFVSRSHDSNISTLMPLFLLGLSCSLPAIFTITTDRRLLVALSLSLIAFFQAIIEPMVNHSKFAELVDDYRQISLTHQVFLFDKAKDAEPYAYETIKALPHKLKLLKISEGEPIVFYDLFLPRLPMQPDQFNPWLPVAPGHEFDILDQNRKLIYVERFLKQKKSGGWLITRSFDSPDFRVFHGSLPKIYRLVERHVDGDWVAEKFVPK